MSMGHDERIKLLEKMDAERKKQVETKFFEKTYSSLIDKEVETKYLKMYSTERKFVEADEDGCWGRVRGGYHGAMTRANSAFFSALRARGIIEANDQILVMRYLQDKLRGI